MQKKKTGTSARHIPDSVAISRGVTAAGTRVIREDSLCKIMAC